jgi:vanillate O-demethylase monooxygenase subunit
MAEDGFLRNQWYAAAASSEIGTAPLGRTICGEPIALFRAAGGTIAALEDRCPHRKYQLSRGVVANGLLQCGYHGLKFDGSGRCVEIPSQATIPRGLNAHTYPAIERHALVFVWLGDPKRADPALIPDFHENDADGFKAVHGYLYVKADYRLLIDNLLDLTHVAVVHKTTLGGPGILENSLEVEVDGDVVRTLRVMRNVDPAPIHRTIRHFPGKIDRRQETEFRPPIYVHINLGAVPHGSNEPIEVPHHVVINSLTPETERTTHYFWSVARTRALDDESVSEKLKTIHNVAFNEDVVVIEAQQRMIDSDPAGGVLANLDGDEACAAARRILARKLAEDQGRVVRA